MRFKILAFWLLLLVLGVPGLALGADFTGTCKATGTRLLTIVDQADASDPDIVVTLSKQDHNIARGLLFHFDATSLTGSAPTARLQFYPINPDGSESTDTFAQGAAALTGTAEEWDLVTGGWDAATFGQQALTGFSLREVGTLFRRFRVEILVGGTITDFDATVDCYVVR